MAIVVCTMDDIRSTKGLLGRQLGKQLGKIELAGRTVSGISAPHAKG
jgi:hypothetical protein